MLLDTTTSQSCDVLHQFLHATGVLYDAEVRELEEGRPSRREKVFFLTHTNHYS